jgi:excisionase family DNA binding protein
MAETWISITEAAQISGYHPEHLRKLIRANKVTARKFGPLWQVNRVDLLTYIRKAKKFGEKRGPKKK